jgi:hypothetical protein
VKTKCWIDAEVKKYLARLELAQDKVTEFSAKVTENLAADFNLSLSDGF